METESKKLIYFIYLPLLSTPPGLRYPKPMKQCKVCDQVKSESEYYFLKNTGKHSSSCKRCHATRSKAIREKNKLHHQNNPHLIHTPKRCIKCRTLKDPKNFTKNPGSVEGIGGVCKQCQKRK